MRNEYPYGGFTLIECCFVFVIVGLLGLIAAPSYQQHLQKSRRLAAKTSLLSLAAHMQEYYVIHRSYTGAEKYVDANDSYYHYQVEKSHDQEFTLCALPQNSQTQDACGELYLTASGETWTSRPC